MLLHFSPEERAAVITMMHRALADGGYLAVEQTQKLPEECERLFHRVTDAGQVFQKV